MSEGGQPKPAPADSPPSSIAVRRSVLAEIARHAQAESPNECCGILLGRQGRIEQAVRARNALGSPTRYLIDPEDHFAALRQARQHGQAVVGFYHSHPASPPLPSPTDVREASYPGSYYLIATPGSLQHVAEIRAFTLTREGNFRPAVLVPVE